MPPPGLENWAGFMTEAPSMRIREQSAEGGDGRQHSLERLGFGERGGRKVKVSGESRGERADRGVAW